MSEIETTDVNFEALRDLSEVVGVFEKRSIKMRVADNGDIIVTNHCYPFEMWAHFYGDGVCAISARFNGIVYGKRIYDSHTLGDLPNIFEKIYKGTYEDASIAILKSVKKIDVNAETKFKAWLIKICGTQIQKWGKNWRICLVRRY